MNIEHTFPIKTRLTEHLNIHSERDLTILFKSIKGQTNRVLELEVKDSNKTPTLFRVDNDEYGFKLSVKYAIIERSKNASDIVLAIKNYIKNNLN